MNNETQQKPFACAVESCDMTFINQDHLDWHKKKHDMMLNLELINKNDESADQTPTPTRFIRNCEEVGLFQDLQHVNPFDETFKKAVDLAKNGCNLEVPESNNSSDTLHTPHILPHLEENQKKNSNSNEKQVTSHSYDFTRNEVETIIVTEYSAKSGADIKQQIIENIRKNKMESKEEMNSFISCVPFEDLTGKKNENIIDLDSGEENESDSNEKKRQIREMNRAAQVRCRKRKQLLWKQMEEEIRNLRQENKILRVENLNMKRQLLQYLERNRTTNHETAEAMTITDNCKTQENLNKKRQLLQCLEKSRTTDHATAEAVTITDSRKTQGNTSQNYKQKSSTAIMIQLVSSGTNPSNPLKQSQTGCLTSVKDKHITKEQGKVKRKIFRKIVPKIVIKK